jgi:hypothetical protein
MRRMAMGKRKRDRQPPIWVTITDLPTAASHPFYRRLNQLLHEHEFDDFAEGQCATFYADTLGRPGLPPGIYFRLLLIGYFEGIDSERGIAWRASDVKISDRTETSRVTRASLPRGLAASISSLKGPPGCGMLGSAAATQVTTQGDPR